MPVTSEDSWVLTHAKLVLPHEVIEGSLRVERGVISAIDPGPAAVPEAIDGQQDIVIPGLIELHTDNLERHAVPRPQVRWPMLAAVLAHDAELAAAGITTVFDSLQVGSASTASLRQQIFEDCVDTIEQVRSDSLTKAEHFLHFRCEISTPNMLERFHKYADIDGLRLISLMDHTPGQRQWVDLDKYRRRVKKLDGLTDQELDEHIQQRYVQQQQYAAHNERELIAWLHHRNLPLATHDDATVEHAQEAFAKGARIAEFPTTVEAATTANALGMQILMGAPNLMLGGSHSGNVATAALAAQGLVDILSSDYVPSSLLAGAIKLYSDIGYSLPDAMATVTAAPAWAAGFEDRGEIAVGKRADLVRLRLQNGIPLVQSVWRAGRRVA
ncbi:alpha-D-ribose 1-methylphosphonate 5-triphosphate diphosphatase [Candidatus Entotheonella palauensis]|uniref:alpha-D-ribose 1-methylphosphonate 5-triphosphate diphosphatase n=1 Tax=Candidatus Entotheonella palauensis TaxID=93172 RepID=UPI000B801D25|nr:alpha-D-ribose 1-methylphosphonate 5-triphosphate diphosphatase [Candidatus Entotheonella palauensis]